MVARTGSYARKPSYNLCKLKNLSSPESWLRKHGLTSSLPKPVGPEDVLDLPIRPRFGVPIARAHGLVGGMRSRPEKVLGGPLKRHVARFRIDRTQTETIRGSTGPDPGDRLYKCKSVELWSLVVLRVAVDP